MKHATIRGKKWRLKSDQKLDGTDLGLCDFENRTIYAPFDGNMWHEKDTIIHECLHANLPDLNEEAVTATANSISGILWRLGWRKKN